MHPPRGKEGGLLNEGDEDVARHKRLKLLDETNQALFDP